MDDYNNEPGYEASQTRYAEVRAMREQRRTARGAEPQRELRPIRETPSYDYTMGRGEDDDLFDQRPKGSFGWVLLTQAVVCLLLLGGLLLAKTTMPNTFRQLELAYTQVMETDMSAREVWAVAQAVFRSLKDEIYVVAPYTEPQTEPSTEPQTEPQTEPSTLPAEDLDGMGGLDLSLAYAEKSCTAVPLLTTVRPVRPVANGQLTSAFGYRLHPISGEEGIHTGMDIGAAEGELIFTAFYGTVYKVGEGKEFGNYVIMNHAGGLQTVYAHCSEVLAQEGMVLRAGEVIAKVGSTGASTGPHLHFEVRLNGLRCDPEPLFPQALKYPLKEAAA